MNIFKRLFTPKIKVSTKFFLTNVWAKINGKWEYIQGFEGLENEYAYLSQLNKGDKDVNK